MAHVAVTTTLPVLDCLWLEKLTRAAEEDGEPLLPAMVTLMKRRSSLLPPSDDSHKHGDEQDEGKALIPDSHNVHTETKFEGNRPAN